MIFIINSYHTFSSNLAVNSPSPPSLNSRPSLTFKLHSPPLVPLASAYSRLLFSLTPLLHFPFFLSRFLPLTLPILSL